MRKTNKIRVENPLVEIDGDEMTRIMWKMIKDKLLFPYLDMNIKYYDLHIKNRDKTNDQITTDAALAVMQHRVGVKCATITPNEDRVKEYGLKKAWKSPNATIRALLNGAVFRKPIMARNIRPVVSSWKKPIAVGRHAYGDVYSNTEFRVDGPGNAELLFIPAEGGTTVRMGIHQFDGPGIIQAIHNTDASIQSFAQACFAFALDEKMDLWFSTKDTISKTYDARFRDIFEQEYQENWRQKFQRNGISYFFTLIDDAVARIMKTKGGILWALKNYDGDVMSDMIASAFGSLAMMTSVLVSPQGYFEYEAAHGTVQKHYYRYLKGEETSTNPMALIFAWTGGLRKRGQLDGTPDVIRFASKLEQAAIETIEAGAMTGDLLLLADCKQGNQKVSTQGFIDAVSAKLQDILHD